MNKTIDEEPFDIPQKLTENILHDIKFTLLQTQTPREDAKIQLKLQIILHDWMFAEII